ncbi:hypothetical protein BDZ91DRAFT_766345 [Kalaharituber pfeilii]|nr:hypothetical protein BDZ91DRAFT_766345 [Kalaharituber pfeilii]
MSSSRSPPSPSLLGGAIASAWPPSHFLFHTLHLSQTTYLEGFRVGQYWVLNYSPLLDLSHTVPNLLSVDTRQQITDPLQHTLALISHEFLALCNYMLNSTTLEDLLTDLESLGQHSLYLRLGTARCLHPMLSSSSANSVHGNGEGSSSILIYRSAQVSRLVRQLSFTSSLCVHVVRVFSHFLSSARPTADAHPNLIWLLQIFISEDVVKCITTYLPSNPANFS